MSDPFAVPTSRRESHAPLVAGVRIEVDAWRAENYPGVTDTTRRLLEHWFLDEHQTVDGYPFRYYFAQREAVETLIYLHEVTRTRSLADMVGRFARTPVPVAPQPYPRYVVKAATGSGKTKVMSLAIAWAYFRALRDEADDVAPTSLVIAPNLIVYERLRTDFEGGAIFRGDPVVPPEWRADFDLRVCLRDDPIPQQAPGVLALTNVQALYERRPSPDANPISVLLGPVPPARLSAPDPLLLQLSRRGRVVVVNDEAHHLHDQVKSDTGEPLVAVQTLRRLHELTREAGGAGVSAQFDFSATPRNQQGQLFPEIVADYPLAQAIEDGIVKRPVIGELSGDLQAVSDDAAERYRQQLGAGVLKWREFRDRLAPAGHRPLLFVMAENTEAADQIAAYLQSLSDLAGRVLTIHVNMAGSARGEIRRDDLELAREAARAVDGPDSPYSAIVSVLMLREGWDVRNVSVIVPLRAYTARSAILPEQTLGRGLRRMTPPGSGVDEQVVVIEHEAFRDLWDKAMDDEGLEIERRRSDDVHPEPVVIAVEPNRLGSDIEIPSLSRTLVRNTADLAAMRATDIPERRLSLPETLRGGTVDYTGRDLLTREVIEQARYELPAADDPGAVLAWYVNVLQYATRLTGQFAVLAPLVQEYIETRVFGGPVDITDPLVLQVLREPAVQETVLGALREAVDRTTLVTQRVAGREKPLLLSATRPFLWSGEVASAQRSVFSGQPCDSGLEVRLCGWFDRAEDVAAFAKLAREVRFSLEYRAENGRLAYYYPDFVVRLTSGEHLVIEAKGLADLDVPRKDERAVRWAADATSASGVRWSYLRVDENVFDRHAPRLRSVAGLVEVVAEVRRQDYLRSQPEPRRRSREEILAAMAKAREVILPFDIEAEVRRLREDPRA
ncbi:DEAD/DEAH box helicase family protein [Blastococcus sp. TML/M2B]|uniref:DEAD/DEAH box helicase n=1 Tax=Blastococcus sp. TML/M2B TaxID=2798727 RepID=UPI00190DA9E6|nr:DEAD/DEAH box helicase family protein [Blastococcus sp. TML/M2B]MBN1091959.1 DEAD/DEAH box helicase family protein [Blastococcus sp. TML/M2B]